MVAPLVPTTPVTPQFKERRKLNAPRVGHWCVHECGRWLSRSYRVLNVYAHREWRAFHNSARSDGVAFYHWEQTRTAEGETIDEQGTVARCLRVRVPVRCLTLASRVPIRQVRCQARDSALHR